MEKDEQEIRIPAKALNIIWGNDSRFWKWIQLKDKQSLFTDAAELLQVNWIEVTGKLDFSELHPQKQYEIVYVVRFNVDAFGWHTTPIKFKVTTSDGHVSEVSEILEPYRKIGDVQHEIRGGEFTVPSSGTGQVYFGMYEVNSDWWKGSMILEGVKIKAKG